jgi:glucan phosphoethanolaminetransferase (alkaline phosphatase superfamily)
VALAPAESAYILAYGHPTDADILGTIFESNLREIVEFPLLTTWALLCMLGALVIAVLSLVQAWRSRLQWIGNARQYTVLIAVLLPMAMIVNGAVSTYGSFNQRLRVGLGVFGDYTDDVEKGYPFGVPLRAVRAFKSSRALHAEVERLRDFRFAVQPLRTSQREIYIMIVGESSRRDHWQLFGYGRPTNPELATTENLVPLPDVISTWSVSRLAIPVLLTRKPGNSAHLDFTEPSIVRAFAEGGFHTAWFPTRLQ